MTPRTDFAEHAPSVPRTTPRTPASADVETCCDVESSVGSRLCRSIPDLYEHYLVPMIFQPYADDLARRLADLHPGDVLELAAGTGAVTRALASRLPASTAITATDLNQPMIDHAAAIGAARPVTWQQADAIDLPFDDVCFDAVVCQFGVMFFPDRHKAFTEMRRVLLPEDQWCSTCGIDWSRTSSKPRSPTRWRPCSPTTRLGSSRALPTGTTTRNASAPISSPPASIRC